MRSASSRASQRLNWSCACRTVASILGMPWSCQRHIVRLGHEGDLVLEVRQAVVDRRGGEHEDAGLHALLDDAPHEAVVAGLAAIVRRLVAEVVGLVDDDEVVVAPVDMGKVDVAGRPPSRERSVWLRTS